MGESASIIIFDEGATPERVLSYLPRVLRMSEWVDTATGVPIRSDVVARLDPSELPLAVPRRYWKHVAGAIIEYTQAEKDAQDAQDVIDREAERIQEIANTRLNAKDEITGFESSSLFLRAFISILIEEINTLRSQHGLADRTIAQLKTAIRNRIDDGTVDT